MPRSMASVPWGFPGIAPVSDAGQEKRSPGQPELPRARVHRHTVDPVIPHPVASPQSRTALRRIVDRTKKRPMFAGRLDTFRGRYQRTLAVRVGEPRTM